MSLSNRRGGRRVAAVIVGASLLVLGLEAPAFAVPPTISSFTPNSGPDGCVVVITGTNFNNPTATDVLFSPTDAAGVPTISAASFAVISATEIWAEVPAAATTGPIAVENATGTGVSTATFTVPATGAGTCAPTITSFAPICGSAGTTVVITGTNLIGPGLVGGDVFFAPYTGAQEADHTVPDVDEPTSLSVVVPTTAGDGPIRVETFNTTVGEGAAFSAAPFDVPPPDCQPVVVEPTKHARSVTLRLRKHLIARGRVTLADPEDTLTECVAGVRVKIQRRVGGRWKNVGATTTNDNGGYRRAIKDKPGKYRALAPRLTLNDGADLCAKRRSPRQTHRHPR